MNTNDSRRDPRGKAVPDLTSDRTRAELLRAGQSWRPFVVDGRPCAYQILRMPFARPAIARGGPDPVSALPLGTDSDKKPDLLRNTVPPGLARQLKHPKTGVAWLPRLAVGNIAA